MALRFGHKRWLNFISQRKYNMLKAGRKNNYENFLKKKEKFAKKVKRGKVFKDTDGDGLCDYEEKRIYGTDPNNPDTDGDGINDGAEIKRGRNPLGPGSFKDLFIPHVGNDYLPHALKPKRLLFHALSVVAMKAVVVVFILFYPLSAWLSPDLALAEVKKIIELTNALRLTISLPALVENRQLAQAAWQKVEDMVLNQYFAHVSPAGLGLRNWLSKSGYKYAVAGENLAVGFSEAEEVVAAWKNSPTHYDNLADKDFKEIGVAMADGQLDQVDTIFIAQYFAAPAFVAQPASQPAEKQPAAAAPSPEKPAAVSAPAPKTSVSGQKTNEPPAEAKPLALASPAVPPPAAPRKNEIIIDQASATLTIKGDQFDRAKAIQIQTALPADTVSAEVIIDNKKINLTKEPGQTDNWSGAAIISREEEKSIMKPLIPASLTVKNSTGKAVYGKLDWDEIKLIQSSLLEHYRLFKANPAAAMKPIMDLSASYFKIILAIAFIAALLNIFIEIRRQHPRIIFYSVAFLGLLSAMIIF